VAGFVAVGAGAAFDRSAPFHEPVKIEDLSGKQRAFRPILLITSGLTPLGSCDNLGPRVADFEPRNPELFHIPYCFSSLVISSECRWRDSVSRSRGFAQSITRGE